MHKLAWAIFFIIFAESRAAVAFVVVETATFALVVEATALAAVFVFVVIVEAEVARAAFLFLVVVEVTRTALALESLFELCLAVRLVATFAASEVVVLDASAILA